MTKKKRGRPTKKVKAEHKLQIRITDKFKSDLMRASQEEGVSMKVLLEMVFYKYLNSKKK